MALRRTTKTSGFFPPKTFLPSYLIPFILYETSHSPHRRTHLHTIYHSSVNPSVAVPSGHTKNTVDGLIAIFTKKPFLRNSEELRNLGAGLTPEIVEFVLQSLRSWRIAVEFFSWAKEQHGYRQNCYTYNVMASILSRARQSAQLRILVTDIVNSRCSMTPGALGFFIRCLGNLSLVDEANYLFDQAKVMGLCVPNNYSYNCLLEAVAKCGRADLVETRLREMSGSGWDLDKFTLTPVLQTYCNSGKFEKALVIFHQIYDQGWVDEHIFAILVVSFSKWGEVDKAFELIERMGELNIRLNEKTLCVLIHGFVRESRLDKALQLFDRMLELGFRPDLPLYDVLIGGLCRKKEFGKALGLYSEMKQSGISPDAGIVSKIILSCCGEGDLVTANQLLQKSGEGMSLESMNMLYNAALQGLIEHGLVEKAHLLLRAMMGAEFGCEAAVDNLFKVKKTVIPNPTAFNIVSDGLCKIGKVDLALSLFRDMIRMGCGGNVLLYNNLINELCNLDRLEEGFGLLSEMKESGFKPTQFTHNAIFGCLCRREDVMGALDLAREMRVYGHEPWIKHTSLLVKQLCTHGRAVEASNFLTGMVQEGFLPDIIAYSAVIDGFFKIRDADRALELFRDIFARGYCADVTAFNILINGLCKAGRVSEAQHVLNEMLEKNLVPSVVTYNSMIDGWCKASEIDRALACFSKMVEEAREPTIVTYTTLIDGLCNAGKPKDALMLWNEMGEKGCSPNRIAYMALIHGLCKCSRAEEARAYFREMEAKEMKPDTFVYVTLINTFLSNRNPISAFEILKEMVQEGRILGPSDKNYPSLINALCKLAEDGNTSSDINNLIAKGCIPGIRSISDIADRVGPNEI